MASSSGLTLAQQSHGLKARLKTLINDDLKRICKAIGKPVSGVKSSLQQRVGEHIDLLVQTNNAAGFDQVAYMINHKGALPQPSSTMPYNSSPPAARPAYHSTNGYSSPMAQRAPAAVARAPIQAPFQFKTSPFYEIREPLARHMELQALPEHRSHSETSIYLSSEQIEYLKRDDSHRIMLYCASEPSMGPYSPPVDVAFPAQLEVRVNDLEVKWNFKGLKNKPGSTRPADITTYFRRQSQYKNQVKITYAQTRVKFVMIVNLVKKRSVAELTERIKRHSVISKDRVLREMQKKADDPDIVATSYVMSLRDPVSGSRINVPCRSTVCSHNACFDASFFLEMQEQGPTWSCPICSKTVSFEGLMVDQYVEEILQSTPKSTEQVTIEPNGQWTQGSTENSNNQNGTNGARDDSDSDDLIDVTDQRVTNLKQEASHTPISLTRTPPLSSREASIATSAQAPRSGSKRSSAVIDLTLSDDDEPVRRPTKRPTYDSPNSLPSSHRNDISYPLQRPMSGSGHSRPPAVLPPINLPQHPPPPSPLQPPPQQPRQAPQPPHGYHLPSPGLPHGPTFGRSGW